MNALIQEVIDLVSVDPSAVSGIPDLCLRLSELRLGVDEAADALIGALARMGATEDR